MTSCVYLFPIVTSQEKEEAKKLKTKQREKMQPKMGRMDIDYQVLHDAFFKYQTRPKLTALGEMYYEGKVRGRTGGGGPLCLHHPAASCQHCSRCSCFCSFGHHGGRGSAAGTPCSCAVCCLRHGPSSWRWLCCRCSQGRCAGRRLGLVAQRCTCCTQQPGPCRGMVLLPHSLFPSHHRAAGCVLHSHPLRSTRRAWRA